MSLLNLLLAGATAFQGNKMAKDLQNQGDFVNTEASALGDTLNTESAFKGYGFTTGIGSGTVVADGTTNFAAAQGDIGTTGSGMLSSANTMLSDAGDGLDAFRAAMAANSTTSATNAMQNTAAREQDIFSRIMGMQNPVLDQQQAAQQAREFAMGRSGIRGSQFGGTAEDAAMARARAQASNQAAVQAMTQAQQEMVNQGNMASQFGQLANQAAGTSVNAGSALGQLGNNAYTASFTPIQTQIQAAQAAAQNASLAQTGQLTGLGYEAQLGLGGLQALVNAYVGAGNTEAQILGAALQAGGQAASGLGNTVSGGFDWTNPDGGFNWTGLLGLIV